ncbi:MAG TPA: carbohydrate ABC transporter permease [Spirochaetia bacterium]|nr:carbohydrate ABC transporter permease [Spirochaetia bacterium]
MAVKKGPDYTLLRIIAYVVVSLAAIACLLPFLMLISSSFTKESEIVRHGFSLLPLKFSLEAYTFAFEVPKRIIDAYLVTITVTAVGTFFSLFFVSMAGYVLQRKDFKYRNRISFIIYFTQLFSVGIIPQYILITRFLGLTDSLLALILPPLLSPFLIILMRTFIKTAVPDSIVESAKIDGASDFLIYRKLILPLSTAGLATIGLFTALGYWNDWFQGSLYIRTTSRYPLQFYLYNLLMSAQMIREMANVAMSTNSTAVLPQESFKMATALIVTGPILLLYPFVQRYFVSGLTIGAVKG